MGSVNGTLLNNYLESVLSGAVQNPAGTTNRASNAATSSIGQQQDSGQLSPLSRLLSTLQQLQQSDPAKYAQVTQQIASNLQTAAQTAQTDGNPAAASQLSTLAADFTKASTSGQLPNIQDLAQALGGGGHHHHHHHSHGAGSSDNSSSSDPNSASSTSTPLSQLLASLNTNSAGTNVTQNDPLNPATVIFDTLQTAGITSNS